ncbi:hypothetical protein LQF76_10660 [Gloeomargaritales cyanobacterium VI4D9]|nr:hypothetical protein LQF76_10660 [Gloeomargaritales cyanobacterium VI4D9]
MSLPPFAWNAGTVAGASLWAIAFYWGFSPQSDRMFTALVQRLPAGLASLVGMVPWLGLGALCEYLCDWSLGKSWGVSLGLLTALGCGVYELGRRSSGSLDEGKD